MNDPSPAGPENRPSLETVLAEYLLAQEKGDAAIPAQVVAAHPHLAYELTAFFECREVVPRFHRPRFDTEPPVRPAGFDVFERLGKCFVT
jgi:hypothetical protein